MNIYFRVLSTLSSIIKNFMLLISLKNIWDYICPLAVKEWKSLHNNVICIRYTYISIWIWKVAFPKNGYLLKYPYPKIPDLISGTILFSLWYRIQSQFLEPITTTLRALPRSTTAEIEERCRSNFVDEAFSFLISDWFILFILFVILSLSKRPGRSRILRPLKYVQISEIENFEFDVISSGVGKSLSRNTVTLIYSSPPT